MDLTKLDVKAAAEKGAVLTLTHPSTGAELEATVTVIGRDSPSVKAVMETVERRKASGSKITKEQEGIELLCAVVKGWTGIEFDGKELEYNAENVRKLITDPRTEWISEQIGPFVLSRRNFAQNLPEG